MDTPKLDAQVAATVVAISYPDAPAPRASTLPLERRRDVLKAN